MRKTLAALSVLAVCASFLIPAKGGDEVTQPACFGWLHRNPPQPSTSRFYTVQPAPVAVAPVTVAQSPACCPQPAPACSSCTTQYVQQSYYQAVTTYQTQTRYEPVTSYQTSFYYEPVTTYRSSFYYCPNSCSYKQTVVPETSYQLKSKTCPVQSYVAKCVQVPVTSYQKAYYYQPQTVCSPPPPPTCCPTTPTCCPQAPVGQAPCCQPGGPPQVSGGSGNPPQVSATPGQAPQTPTPPPPILNQDDRYRKDTTPPKNGGTSWQAVTPTPPIQVRAPISAQETSIKLDRIVLGGDSTVEGEVVRGDKTPRPGAKILFVNANTPAMRETATANHAGRFQVTLAAGGWLIFLYNTEGDAIFHSRIEVSDEQNMGRLVLVNRN